MFITQALFLLNISFLNCSAKKLMRRNCQTHHNISPLVSRKIPRFFGDSLEIKFFGAALNNATPFHEKNFFIFV